MISSSEEFLETTESALECSRQVRILRPLSIGMKWEPISLNCYAKFGVSQAKTDIHGCMTCQTCSFGKVAFYHTSLENWILPPAELRVNHKQFSFWGDGGWREEQFSECSKTCGTGLRRKLKYCDAPSSSGGALCPCNINDQNEKTCDGLYAVIETPCYNRPCHPGIF